MKKNLLCKRTAAVCITAALVLSVSSSVSAATDDKPKVKAVNAYKPTVTYEAYLNGDVKMDKNSGSKIAPYAVSGSSLEPSGALPSSYISETTPVRDQGQYNTCWSFSSIGTLESFLIADGKGQQDLSEQHLAWWSTSQYNTDGYGWLNVDLDTGGYSMIGAGYLASWQGAKLESDVPYYTSGNSMPDNMDTAGNAYNVTGIMYVENDIQSIKSAIYDYGAVATSFNSGGGYNDDMTAYYQAEDTDYFSGHAITVVGWDDNYSRNNFSSSSRPENDGAWLVKNSWGESSGENGYLWISYYDRYLFDTDTWGANLVFTGARTAREYDRLCQNEEGGATFMAMLFDDEGFGYFETTYMNVFDFDSVHDKLQSVIFECTNAGASYRVYYVPMGDDGVTPSTNQSEWMQLGSGLIDRTGYINVDTRNYYLPSNGKAAIAVTIDASEVGEYATLGVSEWLTDFDSNYLFLQDQNRNESFVYVDNNIYDLVDIYESRGDYVGGTLVIKALTTSQIIGDINSDGRVSAMDSFLVQRISAGTLSADSSQRINADTNFDGKISARDSYIIQKKAVGMISDF